ncbi:Uma2 family endonuclease [Aureimonas psammosilenae]|uniref:Uma2 family endonuclease n=1 Tax=Aureimonas psammosilenae TaxID=2495496 RepID=UPI0012605A34|nr:Uma2 family endonuclease [Aureimonas psammosilenae]
MSALTSRPQWTVEEFFAWQETQEERYELVDGFPQPHRMMTGALNGHDDVVVNIIISLGTKLRGSGCRPFTADGSIQTLPDRIRRPDVGVDCGPRDPNDRKAAKPVVVFEVFSPSTRTIDLLTKLDEYQGVTSLRHLVFMEPNRAEAIHWQKGTDGGWRNEVLKGLDAVLDLDGIGVSLALSECYEGVVLET